MSSIAPPRTSARPPGWFANRPLAQKFGALVAVVVLAFGLLLGAVLMGNSDVSTANRQLADLNHAQEVVLQLDTRASELKVDGYKTLVRPDPGAELDELSGDIQTGTDLLDELATIRLTGKSAAAVADLASTFGQYTDAITEFINTGIADQLRRRVGLEERLHARVVGVLRVVRIQKVRRRVHTFGRGAGEAEEELRGTGVGEEHHRCPAGCL